MPGGVGGAVPRGIPLSRSWAGSGPTGVAGEGSVPAQTCRPRRLKVTKAINGVLAALAQGLGTLGEAGEAIKLIERCRRLMGPPLRATVLSHNVRIQFVSASGAGG